MPTFIAYVGGEIKEKMEGANKAGLEAMIAKYAKWLPKMCDWKIYLFVKIS